MKYIFYFIIIVLFSCQESKEINIKGDIHFTFIDLTVVSEEFAKLFPYQNMNNIESNITKDLLKIKSVNPDLYDEILLQNIRKDLENLASILININNNERIRVIIPRKIYDKIWEIKPQELIERKQILFVNFIVIKYKNVLILKNINSMNYIEGNVSFSK